MHKMESSLSLIIANAQPAFRAKCRWFFGVDIIHTNDDYLTSFFLKNKCIWKYHNDALKTY